MRVCIPIPFRAEGGGFYFLDSLRNHLRSAGWPVVDTIDDRYEVLFTNHWMVSLRDIRKAIVRNRNVCVVQRIDGAAQDYGRGGEADKRQRAVNHLADLTIFQSQYCRYSTSVKYPVIVHDGPVISNPVDVELFRPDGPKIALAGKVRIACVTWSTNPMKGGAEIYAVAAANPDVDFHLCGRYPDAPPLANVHRHGVLGREELAATLRSCHILLTFSRNEACPNHVLEALSSGLPVLYQDSGATAEIVRGCGESVTVNDFSDRLSAVLARRDALGSAARDCIIQYNHPKKIFADYLDAIGAAVQRPRPRGARFFSALLMGSIPDVSAIGSAAASRLRRLSN